MQTVRSSQPQLEGVIPYDPKYLPATHLLSANENPHNVPEQVQVEILKALKDFPFNRYPDPLANDLCDVIADANGLSRDSVLLGNGGDELLFDLALAWGGEGRTMLNMPPTFSVYEANARLTNTKVVNIPRTETYDINEPAVLKRLAQGDIDYLIITSPNNPTGKLTRASFIERVLESTDALVMVDEAYFEFSRFTVRPLLDKHKNLIILRTFSKAFSLAGVRLGYILGNPEVIREFLKVRQPYSVDALSQAIGRAVYHNRALFVPGIDEIISQRDVMIDALRDIPGVEAFDSDSNFILVCIPHADEIWQKLYDRGFLVRNFSSAPYLTNCLRISVGLPEENVGLINVLREIMTTEVAK